MRRLLFASMLAVMMVAGCSPSPGGSDGESPTVDPNQPVSSDDTPAPTREPTPREGEWIEGEASVESIDIVMMESFPLQIRAVVRGTIGDSCTEMDDITTTREGDTFKILLTTVRDADAVCTQIAEMFEENVRLDVYGLAAGTYTVDANGVTTTFTLEQDNILEPIEDTIEPLGTDQMMNQYQYGLANVTGAEVYVKADSVEVMIVGWLPNPCVQLYDIQEEPSGSSVRLTVQTREQTEMACIQVIEDFSHMYTLKEKPQAGHYMLIINDYTIEFDVR